MARGGTACRVGRVADGARGEFTGFETRRLVFYFDFFFSFQGRKWDCGEDFYDLLEESQHDEVVFPPGSQSSPSSTIPSISPSAR